MVTVRPTTISGMVEQSGAYNLDWSGLSTGSFDTSRIYVVHNTDNTDPSRAYFYDSTASVWKYMEIAE